MTSWFPSEYPRKQGGHSKTSPMPRSKRCLSVSGSLNQTLIVAPPDLIPFSFQYSLDIYWAVGRLWFDTANEFRQYAESVLQHEKMSAVPTARKIALFATEHDFDNATQLFTKQVVRPMIDGEGARPIPIGKQQKFGLQTYLGEAATKETLGNILRGLDGGVPSLLFS